jgi:(3S)-malyl-CoA thioesterase
VPASNTRAIEKISTFQGSNQPDAIMLDLEDGVAPTSKDSARENLVKYFQRDDDGSSIFPIVRINSVDSPWFIDDISAVAQLVESDASIAVCLPKIECLDDIEFVSKELRDRCCNGGKPIPLWPMIETPRAILTSLSISSHPSIDGLILGTNDLSKYLNIPVGTREGLTTSLQMTILAAKSVSMVSVLLLSTVSVMIAFKYLLTMLFVVRHATQNDKIVIDGVYNNFHDLEGLYQESIQGKKWGMDGKTLIHPNQVQTANEVVSKFTFIFCS